MTEPWLSIEVSADTDAPFTAMFEPSGMTYELRGDDRMFADVHVPNGHVLRIVNWQGGISVWAPGEVVTRDAEGVELHRLN
jgi:hypothetical protein